MWKTERCWIEMNDAIMSQGIIYVSFNWHLFICSSVSIYYDVNIKAFCKEDYSVSCGAAPFLMEFDTTTRTKIMQVGHVLRCKMGLNVCKVYGRRLFWQGGWNELVGVFTKPNYFLKHCLLFWKFITATAFIFLIWIHTVILFSSDWNCN